ncbi:MULTISPECIES: trimeric intracellular cation channel family protein [unclassified Simplicispira]|uniref:trimeric intracellular cation channel family protein n=1 Tax=unclassified Simplicispira TaxID=2630407 RepID=UPI000D5FB447|nr:MULTISPECIES: trimeric intracellular cation channel family protein [unclassified Simplicispira]PVY55237.1 putative membrane protein YeiH [Simplicispira sp. 125]REG16180.1 putative membrane protein YeiH [Simplicispira sp. 110]
MNVHELALAGLNDHRLFTTLDLTGTFAFAISGAVAARDRGLDWFGVVAIAFTVACGGGVLRDLCIGAVPPAGLTDWRYLAVAMAAASMTITANTLVVRLAHPVILFDTIGLGLFAVTGAQKAMIFGHNAEVAVLLGIVTAVGGGVVRDVLLNRVPVILQREIYASAALVGASIEVFGEHLGWLSSSRTWVALVVCFALRYLSLHYKWNLPHSSRHDDNGSE